MWFWSWFRLWVLNSLDISFIMWIFRTLNYSAFQRPPGLCSIFREYAEKLNFIPSKRAEYHCIFTCFFHQIKYFAYSAIWKLWISIPLHFRLFFLQIKHFEHSTFLEAMNFNLAAYSPVFFFRFNISNIQGFWKIWISLSQHFHLIFFIRLNISNV